MDEKLHNGILMRSIWENCPERRFFYGERGEYHSGLQDGDFLLNNRCCTVAPVFEQEMAICVNAKPEKKLGIHWLVIKQMPSKKLSWNEATEYLEEIKSSLPSFDALALLMPRQKLLNFSLNMIGRKDLLISDYALGDYWYAECNNYCSKPMEKRKLAIIETVPEYFVQNMSLGRFDKYFSCNEVITVHRDAVDMYWVLQPVGDWYYALEDRCLCNLYNRSDRCSNGRVYKEDEETLIIENPGGDKFSSQGGWYIKTYKNIYRKNDYGIYTRRGCQEGAVPID